MFREIQIKNFRGLKDSTQIQLAPLTVFTGPEGSGKSSIGHFLTMLKQTVDASDLGVVIYPGDKDSHISLGTQSSILYNSNRELEFSYRFDLPSYVLMEDPEKDKFNIPTQFLFGENIRFHCILDTIQSRHLSVKQFSYELYDKNTKVVTASTQRSTLSTKNKKSTQFAVEIDGYVLKNKTGRPWLQEPPTHFYGFSKDLNTYYKNVEGLFNLSKSHASKISNIYYVGTDRNRFNSLHLWSGLRRFDVGHNGTHAISALLGAASKEISLGDRKRNQPVQDIVKDLLQRLQLIDDMHIEDLTAVEDGYSVKVTARKSKQVVDLSEAGKAVGQILPILIQCFCAPSNSTIVLDGIETHLSAQSQALLADILLDVIHSKEDAEDRNIQLIVSTHSEVFLRRLQRRIAEGKIPNSMVKAYYTNNYRRGIDIQSIPLIAGNHLHDLSQYFTFADDDRHTTIEVAEHLPTQTERTLTKPIKPEPKKIVQKSTRKPGRPKGSKNKSKTDAENKPKRGPGRPKGSKNKPKENTEPVLKRGPGRPKGSKNKPKTDAENKPKRGPGRPKGSKNKNSKPTEIRTAKDATPKQKKENKRAKRLKNRHASKLD